MAGLGKERLSQPGGDSGPAILLDVHPGPIVRCKGKERAVEGAPADGAEVQRRANGRDAQSRTFWRRAKWSPDGSHVLLHGERHSLQTMRLRWDPSQIPGATSEAESSTAARLEAGALPAYQAPAPLLDAAWYPYADAPSASRAGPSRPRSSADTDTPSGGGADAAESGGSEPDEWAKKQSWCFLSSVRNVPVRLVDADSGASRTSYGVQDHVERFVGPTSIAFSPYGDRFYAGHDSYLTIHDLASPGLNTHIHMALAGPAANQGSRRLTQSQLRQLAREGTVTTKRTHEAGAVGLQHASAAVADDEAARNRAGKTEEARLSKRAKFRLKRLHRRRIAALQQRGILSALAVCLDPAYHAAPETASLHSEPGPDGSLPQQQQQQQQRRAPELLAVGTFSGSVGLYALGRGQSAGEACVAGWLEAASHSGSGHAKATGISQLAFHPAAPNLLFVQSRRSAAIRVYDIRLLCGCLAVDFGVRAQASYEGRTSGTLVAVLHPGGGSGRGGARPKRKRAAKGEGPGSRSQQRLFFDVHTSGKWLCAGDADGTVRIWDIDLHGTITAGSSAPDGADVVLDGSSSKADSALGTNSSSSSAAKARTLRSLLDEYEARLVGGAGDAQSEDVKAIQLGPRFTWTAHDEPVACATFHPTLPLLLTLGGSRATGGFDSRSSAESQSDDDSSGSEADQVAPPASGHLEALKLWYLQILQ